MAMTGALSSYDIPEQDIVQGTPVWLSNCIAEAAKHLDQAPFLQLLLRSQNFEHHPVPSAVVQVVLFSTSLIILSCMSPLMQGCHQEWLLLAVCAQS